MRRMRGIEILHEDEDLLVVEKAAGVLSQSTRRGDDYCVASSLTDYVRKGQARSRRQVYLVHRLDRETSGVMVVAKTPEAEGYFRSRWNEITEKTYLALVEGRMADDAGAFESYLSEDPRTLRVRSVPNPAHGKLARTEWRVLERRKGTSLVEAKLHTGRKNQIRVHFAEAGHPVVGDRKYGGKGAGLCLHAWRLAFVHPRTRVRVEFESAPPRWAQAQHVANQEILQQGEKR